MEIKTIYLFKHYLILPSCRLFPEMLNFKVCTVYKEDLAIGRMNLTVKFRRYTRLKIIIKHGECFEKIKKKKKRCRPKGKHSTDAYISFQEKSS